VNKSRRRTPTERAEGRLTLFPSAGVTMALLFVSVGSSRGGEGGPVVRNQIAVLPRRLSSKASVIPFVRSNRSTPWVAH
jgi:hypothetical protein